MRAGSTLQRATATRRREGAGSGRTALGPGCEASTPSAMTSRKHELPGDMFAAGVAAATCNLEACCEPSEALQLLQQPPMLRQR